MVRIRKKTSNRATTAHRAKVKHKARETKKKNRKDAKKNPHLHRKKKKKDLGVPNSFPFKEQILAEVAESRRMAIEEKRNKEGSKRPKAALDGQKPAPVTEHTVGGSLKLAIAVTTGRADVAEEEAPLLIDTTIPNTAVALQVVDLVINVLDARDPLSYRSTYVEGILGNTPLLYVLNKIDSAPREAVASWVTHLRQSYPTFLFRSASAYLPTEPLTQSNKSKVKASTSDAVGRDVILEALHTIADSNKLPELTVAIVGVTNVGKSAFISSLIGKPALAVYNPLAARDAAPSTTPHPQSVTMIHKKRTFKLIDTPGLSFIPPSDSSAMGDSETRLARDVLLRNRGNISKIKDPLPAALYILSRAAMEDMIMLYNLPAVQAGDYDGFLASLARKEGALQRRGAVDFHGAAKALVRDWKMGRFAFYTLPPPADSNRSAQTTSKLPSLAPLFEKSDERMLSGIMSRKELRKAKGGLVQLRNATADERRVDLEVTVDLMDEDDSDEDGMAPVRGPLHDDVDLLGSDEEGDDEDFSADSEADDPNGGESMLEDDSGEDTNAHAESDEAEEQPSLLVAQPKLSGKKGRVALQVERGTVKQTSASKKGMSFAPYTKAGIKSKATKAATSRKSTSPANSVLAKGAASNAIKKATVLASSRNNAIKRAKLGSGPIQGDGDAYDFSKYF